MKERTCQLKFVQTALARLLPCPTWAAQAQRGNMSCFCCCGPHTTCSSKTKVDVIGPCKKVGGFGREGKFISISGRADYRVQVPRIMINGDTLLYFWPPCRRAICSQFAAHSHDIGQQEIRLTNSFPRSISVLSRHKNIDNFQLRFTYI